MSPPRATRHVEVVRDVQRFGDVWIGAEYVDGAASRLVQGPDRRTVFALLNMGDIEAQLGRTKRSRWSVSWSVADAFAWAIAGAAIVFALAAIVRGVK